PSQDIKKRSMPELEAQDGQAGIGPGPCGSGRPSKPFQELYENSGAAAFELSLEEFARILRDIGAQYLATGAARDCLPGQPRGGVTGLASDEACAFYATLRLNELVLARACAKGVERAWEVFLNLYREKLYRAAFSITRE